MFFLPDLGSRQTEARAADLRVRVLMFPVHEDKENRAYLANGAWPRSQLPIFTVQTNLPLRPTFPER
jgi:hypothetical protein